MTVTENEDGASGPSTIAEQNEELREIPAETRRTAQGWRQIGTPTERSENFGAAVRRLVDLLRPERFLLALIALMAIGTTVLNVLGPLVLGDATDVVIEGVSGTGIDFARLHRILFQAGALYAGAALLGIGIAYTLAGVVQRLMFRLREQAEAKLNALPLSYIDASPAATCSAASPTTWTTWPRACSRR